MYDSLQMGDPKKEVTEEDRDAAQVAKGKAMEALGESEFLGWMGDIVRMTCVKPVIQLECQSLI